MSSQTNQDVTVRVTAKDMGVAGPFKDLAKNAKEAGAAIKGMAASGGGSGGPSRLPAVLQALGLGSFGGIALGGGLAGVGALAAKDLGGAGLNAMYSRKYGGGPMQREDSGMILGQLGGMIDTLTGRKFREAQQDKATEKVKDEAAQREMVQQQANAMGDAFRQMSLNRRALGTTDEQRRAAEGNIESQLNPIQNRARQAAIQGNEQRLYRNQQEEVFLKGTGKARSDALKEQLAAQMELSRLAKQEIQDNTKIAQLLGQQKDLRLQALQATGEGIKNQAAELGGMDKLGRMQATELGGKLKRGEKLTPQEMEAAQSFGILGGLVRETRIKEMDQSGDLASFLKAAGNEAEKAIAVKAAASNVSIDVQLQLDEQQISQAIGRGLAPINARIEKLTVRIAENDQNMRLIQDRQGKDRGAVFEQ